MTDVLDEAGISYEEKNFQAFNIMANIVRIIGIVASFYYWRWISL
jgi:hypothetical protein